MIEPPAWAEWAAYQWTKGHYQRQIADALGVSHAMVCIAIKLFLEAELSPNATIRCWQEDRRKLAKRFFERRPAPTQPKPLLVAPGKISPALARARAEMAVKMHSIGRVFDPDEATAQRGVWIE